jgi:hypothetical protein
MLTTLNSRDIIEWRLATPDLDLIKEVEQGWGPARPVRLFGGRCLHRLRLHGTRSINPKVMMMFQVTR